MATLEDIFGTWESIAEAARAFDLPYHRVAKWHQRGRIPPTFWPTVIAAADREGRRVTADDLLRATAKSA